MANSSAVYFNQKDVNYSHSYSGRASLRWEPTPELELTDAFNYSRVTGNGGPTENAYYRGGPSPTDPRVIFPATGNYEIVSETLEPYARASKLSTLDASYDLGFATLSATTSYFDTDVCNNSAETQVIENSAALRRYYIGTPINPRFIAGYAVPDRQHSFTQEVRLVSKAGGKIDYTVGFHYQNERREEKGACTPGRAKPKRVLPIASVPLESLLGRTLQSLLPCGLAPFSNWSIIFSETGKNEAR